MEVIDIMKRDDLAILNTIATTEGTIEVAIKILIKFYKEVECLY